MTESPAAGAKAARALAAKLKKQWRKANAGDAAAALAAHPELARHPSVAADLAYEEYLLLEQAGAAPTAASFAARFPACRAEVHSVIAMHRRLTEEPELLDAAAWPEPGETVGGVELLSVLGGGAFGRAYLAYDPATDRPCVLKLTAGPSAEARVIGRLDHPNVTTVYWAGEVDGRSAVCMPLVGANTLDEVIAAAFPPGGPAAKTADVILTVAGADAASDAAPAEEVVRAGEPYLVGAAAVAACVARAVAYVHGQGVAHGDLKPLNVVIGRRGSPLLIDFNLSTRADGPAAVRGTPGYLAPELLEAADPLAATADPKRADLFALGVLVTELLTGRRPFPPADPKSFAAQAAAARTPPAIAAAVPAPVAAVLRACLSPDPAARPASAAVLAAALERVVAAARAPRRWWRPAAAVTLAVAVVVTYWLTRPPAPPPEPPGPAEGTAEWYFDRGWKKKAAADWAGAADDFLKAHKLSNNNWALALGAYCEAAFGKHDDAIGHARWADDQTGGGAPPDVLNVVAYSQVQRGRDEQALPVLDRALARESLPAAHFNRGLARHRLGRDPAGAAADMRATLAAGPGSLELHSTAARVFAVAAGDSPAVRAEALAQVRAAVGMGAPPAAFRGDSVFRAAFGGGFGSSLAFEAALAAPRGPTPAKPPQLRLVEPRPF